VAAVVTDRRGGAVIFLTGLSGAGKSTIAEALAGELRAGGSTVTIVDGDELRRRVSADLGYDPASREANARRATDIAIELATEGEVVITALIAPFEASRREARERIEAVAPFVLVYVRTPLEVAESRDIKGLYKRARAGEIRDFTGIDSPYEEPLDADLVIDTTSTPALAAARMVRRALDQALEEAAR
jgi:sulfate adenylyltransferase